MHTVTIRVDFRNIATLTDRLAKAARKAKRLGLASITWTIDATDIVTMEREDPTRVARVERDVTVSGPAPSWDGWSLVAIVDHRVTATIDGTKNNLVRTVPGETAPARARTCAPECDHCRMDRRRAETFVVRHEDGRTAHVGRSCLRDFLGAQSPEAIAEMLAVWTELEVSDTDEGGREPTPWLTTEMYLACVVALVRDPAGRGYVSRARAEEYGGSSTANEARRIYLEALRDRRPIASDAALAEARTILTWIRAEWRDHSDYAIATRVAAASTLVAPTAIGYLASSVAAYDRAVGARRIAPSDHPAVQPSRHIGVVGQRMTLRLTLVRETTRDSRYGTTHILGWVVEGTTDQVTWFSSSGRASYRVGRTYEIEASIKSHGDWQGTAQTIITRGRPLHTDDQTGQAIDVTGWPIAQHPDADEVTG